MENIGLGLMSELFRKAVLCKLSSISLLVALPRVSSA